MSEKKMNLQKLIRKKKTNDIKKFFKDYHDYVGQDPENRHELFLFLKMNLLNGLSAYEKQELSSEVVPLNKLRELYELLAYIFDPLNISTKIDPNQSYLNKPSFTPNNYVNENIGYGYASNQTNFFDGAPSYYSYEYENNVCLTPSLTGNLIARNTCSLNSEGENDDQDENETENPKVTKVQEKKFTETNDDNYELNSPDVVDEVTEEHDPSNEDIKAKYKELQEALENLKELKIYLEDEAYTKEVFDFNDESNEPAIFKIASHINEYNDSLARLHSEDRINIFTKSSNDESVFSRLLSTSPEKLKSFLHFMKSKRLKKAVVDFCCDDKSFRTEMKKQKKEHSSDHSKLLVLNSIEYFCFNRAKP